MASDTDPLVAKIITAFLDRLRSDKGIPDEVVEALTTLLLGDGSGVVLPEIDELAKTMAVGSTEGGTHAIH